MKPTNDNDDANASMHSKDADDNEENLMTDMAIAEEAEARYREHGINGTRPYSEYRVERLARLH